jgi:thiosulfate/3-mercaptopyruvate sulfurtransferase
VTCHGGNGNEERFEFAHVGVNTSPSADVNGICAQCHQEATETYGKSLHYTVRGFANSLIEFSGDPNALDNPHEGLGEVFNLNCMNCHATCGECHVSRPSGYAGGLIDKHKFFNSPPMDQTCFGCHGARNAGEFMGTVGFSQDVHYEAGMTCVDCHDVNNFHGTGEEYASMWDKPVLPSCLDCHEEVASGSAKTPMHNIHGDTLSCQVCHAQANQNCFECHADISDDRTSLASHSEMRVLFRIGLNPEPTEERPYKYVALRHIPTTADSFVEAGDGLLPNYDNITNWKYSPTHNIQKSTFQNESCDSCHGNPRIFLNENDLRETDSEANKRLIAPPPASVGY